MARKKTKENRVKAERERLFTIFRDMDENQFAVVLPLIEQAAFARPELEDLQVYLQKNGWTAEYKNGQNQYGTKASAEAEAYRGLKKLYDATIFKLAEMVPKKTPADDLEEFLSGG